MTQRIGISRLPQVELVDMTKEARMGDLPALSRRLQDELCAAANGARATARPNIRTPAIAYSTPPAA